MLSHSLKPFQVLFRSSHYPKSSCPLWGTKKPSLLCTINPLILGISKTWLQPSKEYLHAFAGYKIFPKSRQNHIGENIALNVRHYLKCSLHEDLDEILSNGPKCVSLEVCINSTLFSECDLFFRQDFVSFYMPLSRMVTEHTFLGILILTCFIVQNKNSVAVDYVHLAASFASMPLISWPTQSPINHASCIDHIISNDIRAAALLKWAYLNTSSCSMNFLIC